MRSPDSAAFHLTWPSPLVAFALNLLNICASNPPLTSTPEPTTKQQQPQTRPTLVHPRAFSCCITAHRQFDQALLSFIIILQTTVRIRHSWIPRLASLARARTCTVVILFPHPASQRPRPRLGRICVATTSFEEPFMSLNQLSALDWWP